MKCFLPSTLLSGGETYIDEFMLSVEDFLAASDNCTSIRPELSTLGARRLRNDISVMLPFIAFKILSFLLFRCFSNCYRDIKCSRNSTKKDDPR